MTTESFSVMRFAVAMIKKIWIVALAAAVGLAAYFPFVDHTQFYSAEATVYAVVKSSYSEVSSGRDALVDYVEVIVSNKVMSRAAANLGQYGMTSDMLKAFVHPQYIKGSTILRIVAMSQNSQMSIDIANAVQDAFLTELNSITGIDTVKVLDYADPSTVSRRGTNNTRSALMVSAGFGAAAFMALAVMELFDDRLRRVEDVTLGGKIKIIGAIPMHNI